MSGELMMTEAWERLRALGNGMGNVARLFEAEQWDEVGKELRDQETRAQEFSRWLGDHLNAPAVAGEMTHQCCQELQGQLGLVAELRGTIGRRRAELLEDMEQLNQQQRVAKEYGRVGPMLGGASRAQARSFDGEGTGRPRAKFRSRSWDHRQLATYGLNRE